MKKQERRKQKGITLVALVVTIIMLIILAGVTLNIVLDNDGIINKAKQAAEEYENAQKEEQELLGQLEDYWEYDEKAGVNKPELVEGMIPVKWNGTAWVKADENNTNFDWYQYDTTNKKWANVVTVKETGTKTREQYQQAGVNEVIDEEDIVGMFVWIPRYSYQITNGYHEAANGTGTIEIKFLKGTTDNYEGGTAQRNNKSNEDFVVHPCFTNGATTGYTNGEYNRELTGIWVAKFEASSSTTTEENPNLGSNYGGGNNIGSQEVTIRPNVTSWRNLEINNVYMVCKNLTKSGNIHGLTNGESHMMKNSEWGAIAYLTQSEYGNPQKSSDGTSGVWNNSYNEGDIEQTGVSSYAGYSIYGTTRTGMVGIREGEVNGRDNSSAWGAKQTNKTVNGDGSITIEYGEVYNETDTQGNPSGIPYTTTYYSYETEQGQKGSSTRNIYGIYDLAGGAWEYIASYLSEIEIPESGQTVAQKSVKNFNENVAEWEKMKYAGTRDNNYYEGTRGRILNYRDNSEKYGDALWETAAEEAGNANVLEWNGDYDYFPDSMYPLFIRGGHYTSYSISGVFAFSYTHGMADGGASFHPVVVPSL